MKTQHILSYRIGLYFCDYKLAIDIDENGYSNRNIDYDIERQKAIEQELSCKYIKNDPDKVKKTPISLKPSMKYLEILNFTCGKKKLTFTKKYRLMINLK